eukprot:TRINITY_DN2126_c0_g1_i3.p1 TRINITY_DN2126_c0_g1~~TRINITY_DN2126_c0_g1_i3.p1  ORF type:complete len:290 (-),score=54.06 TRINITY_DN2126_c0_g1_i3:258-1127(-)
MHLSFILVVYFLVLSAFLLQHRASDAHRIEKPGVKRHRSVLVEEESAAEKRDTRKAALTELVSDGYVGDTVIEEVDETDKSELNEESAYAQEEGISENGTSSPAASDASSGVASDGSPVDPEADAAANLPSGASGSAADGATAKAASNSASGEKSDGSPVDPEADAAANLPSGGGGSEGDAATTKAAADSASGDMSYDEAMTDTNAADSSTSPPPSGSSGSAPSPSSPWPTQTVPNETSTKDTSTDDKTKDTKSKDSAAYDHQAKLWLRIAVCLFSMAASQAVDRVGAI